MCFSTVLLWHASVGWEIREICYICCSPQSKGGGCGGLSKHLYFSCHDCEDPAPGAAPAFCKHVKVSLPGSAKVLMLGKSWNSTAAPATRSLPRCPACTGVQSYGPEQNFQNFKALEEQLCTTAVPSHLRVLAIGFLVKGGSEGLPAGATISPDEPLLRECVVMPNSQTGLRL